MDYSVKDSSIWQPAESFALVDKRENGLYIGMVRQEITAKDGSSRYVVEILMGGRQAAITCVLLTKWGGAHNYEEYRVRSWQKTTPSGLLPPTTAGTYNFRSGDTVLVGFLQGQAREGVILGGLRHPAKIKDKIPKNKIEYISSFNGLKKEIRQDGSFKVEFKGLPINDKLLDIPGTPVVAPVYNPLISGSYYGFSKNGSYVVSDGKQYIKIAKSLTSGAIILVSGKNRIELGGNPIKGSLGIKSDTVTLESLSSSVSSTLDYSVKTLQYSVKATKLAIGNDVFELFSGLGELIDALGTLVVTSPIGTCTPLMAAPTWAAKVLPLKIKLMAVTGSLKDPKSFSSSADEDPDLGTDID